MYAYQAYDAYLISIVVWKVYLSYYESRSVKCNTRNWRQILYLVLREVVQNSWGLVEKGQGQKNVLQNEKIFLLAKTLHCFFSPFSNVSLCFLYSVHIQLNTTSLYQSAKKNISIVFTIHSTRLLFFMTPGTLVLLFQIFDVTNSK
jgi:hypothetical protein